MAISYTGSACELREVVLRDKPTSMLNYSAKGTVPVLVLPNRVVDESLDVMLWALNRNDPDGWLNVNCAEADDLIRQSDEEFKPILVWLDVTIIGKYFASSCILVIIEPKIGIGTI